MIIQLFMRKVVYYNKGVQKSDIKNKAYNVIYLLKYII